MAETNAIPAEPNWNAIDADPIRREHEIPWLDQEIEAATQAALNASDQVALAEWRGHIRALKTVRDFPAAQVQREADEAREAQARAEEEANARRRARSRFGWLRRLKPIQPL